ncbi:MAG: DUF2520 domain-containing protein [Bacteroidales bacterium]|nr:DUF2520 domain-containing protein [Bacteroidales bacterium]
MIDSIFSISFIGSGNVATHLARALHNSGHLIEEVFSPRLPHAKRFAEQFGCNVAKDLKELNPKVNLLIIAVPDAKVEEVAKALPKIRGIVVHTSGVTGMDALKDADMFGVLYPLQTFTRNRRMDISDAPFCIEGSDERVSKSLFQLAGKMSRSVQLISSKQRKELHLAAVMVSNFVNHLYAHSQEYLGRRQLDFSLLLPLIRETAAKVQDISPKKAQTGPARRKDEPTIKTHLEMLKSFPETAALYHLFSTQIKKKYNE